MVFRPIKDHIMILCYWSEIQKPWKNLKSMILLWSSWNFAWMSFFAMCDFLDEFWKNMITYRNTLLLGWNPNSWKILKSINLLQFQWNLSWMSFFAICDFWDGFWNNMITYNNTLLSRWNPKSWKNLKPMILHWFQ